MLKNIWFIKKITNMFQCEKTKIEEPTEEKKYIVNHTITREELLAEVKLYVKSHKKHRTNRDKER